jgi:hypothetical protein
MHRLTIHARPVRHAGPRNPAARVRVAVWVGFVVACALASWSGTHSVREFKKQAPAIAAKPVPSLGSR